jgi:hypothetical protein
MIPFAEHPAPVDSASEITRFLGALRNPGEVVELRALKVRGSGRPFTVSGYFRIPEHLPDLIAGAVSLERASGVYTTLNPVHESLLSRYHARLEYHPESTTSDKEIVQRTRLLIDIDPTRFAWISASEGEKKTAWDVAQRVREDRKAIGWTEPIICDSGNGYHLIYAVDLPSDDGGKVAGILKSLAKRFDTPHATVDTSTFNASRIVKLPGTWARKGDHTPERPHRMARLLEVPA